MSEPTSKTDSSKENQNSSEQKDRYINRELSLLEFNSRVLEEGLNPSLPLLERLRFFTIFSSNMDEFFMIRVAGQKKILEEGFSDRDSPDEMGPLVILSNIHKRAKELVDKQYHCFRQDLLPQLREKNVIIASFAELSPDEQEELKGYYRDHVFPVLTPLAVDPAHPFPYLANRALYLAVLIDVPKISEHQDSLVMGLVEIPPVLSRLVPVKKCGETFWFIPLEDLVASQLDTLFVGLKIQGSFPIRVSRNLDYSLLENDVVDLLKAIHKELISLEHKTAVRLEACQTIPPQVLDLLKSKLSLSDSDVYLIDGPLVLNGFSALCDLPLPELKYQAFNPRLPTRMAEQADIFSIISQKDLLVHHPYESFYTVVEFLTTAANDPNVLAIKKTFYRTSVDSPTIDSLITAAENGKHVTAVIELKARFDEKNNIAWAQRLEKAGVSVVYGFVELKTHAKAILVVRKEGNKLVRYAHLATGNYSVRTASQYTDLGLFTRDEVITAEIADLFNLITGFNVLSGESRVRRGLPVPVFKTLAVAPINMRQRFLELIDREIEIQKKGGRGLIIAKMNALVDKPIIDRLYEASRAGVLIQLLVRGICCLRPGIQGLSENIKVRSIVDRFLEHSRIYFFSAGGENKVYLSSADWMPRNMVRRIEVLFPVRDKDIQARIINEILETYLRDNEKAWIMMPDGSYQRVSRLGNEPKWQAQGHFIDIVRQQALKSLPYYLSIRPEVLRSKIRPLAEKNRRRERERT